MGQTNVTKEVVELTAIDNASRVIQGVGNAAANLGKVYDGLIAKMASLGLAAGGLGSAGAFAAMIKSTIEMEAGLLRLSEKTGNTVEALSSLMRVAKMSNTDMDEIGKGMQKLAKAMAEAEGGGGKAAQVFKALDIAIRDASTGAMKPTQVVMQELGQKLMQMKDQTLAVAFAQETMGKAGANLLPFLYELARAGELQAKVTTEQAKQAKEFEDNLVRLKASSSDFWRHLANDMLPTMTKYLDLLLEAKKAAGGLGSGLLTMATADTGNIRGRIAEIDKQLAFNDPNKWGNKAANFFTMGFSGTLDALTDGRALAERDYLLAYERKQALERASALGDTGDQVSRRFGPKALDIANPFALGGAGDGGVDRTQMFAVWEMQVKAFKELEAAGLARAKAAEIQRLAEEKLDQQYENQAEAVRKLIDPTRQYMQAIAEAEDLMKKGKLTQDELTAATAKYQEQINRTLDHDLPKSIEKTNDWARQMGITFTSSFEQAAIGGQKLSKVLQGILKDLLQMTLRRGVTEPLGAMFTGGLSSLFGIGGTFGPALGGGGGATAGLAMPFMPASFHAGGVVGYDHSPFGRSVSMGLFAGAPRLHSGLNADEFPAILQRGETVTPRGQRPGGMMVTNIINVESTGDAKEDGDIIAGKVTEAMRNIARSEARMVVGDELRIGGMLRPGN